MSGQIKYDSENGLTSDGSVSAAAEMGVKLGVHFKLSASTALFSPEIKSDKEWKYVLCQFNLLGGTVSETVLKNDTDNDDTNNEKLSDVKVIIERQGASDSYLPVYTDGDGKYEFSDVASDGKYRMVFTKDGFDEYKTDYFDMTQPDVVVNVFLTPSAHSSLHGKVTEADEDTDLTNNDPLSDVQVLLKMVNGQKNVQRSATTDGNGEYTISDLPVGLYDVTFTKSGYITTTQSFEIAQGVENYYNTTIESISDEHNGKGTASGTIYDYLTGDGVEGLTLYIRQGVGTKSGDIMFTITSSTDGEYNTPELDAGAYTVQVTDNRNGVSKKYLTNYFNIKVMGNMNIANQNGAVGTSIAEGQIRIVLRWGERPSDLDSHLVGPTSNGGKFHTFYSNKTYREDGEKIADLDLDDTSSWGPETTTIYNPIPGIYKFCVQDFSNRDDENNTALSDSGAYVQIFKGMSSEPVYSLYVPQGMGTVWEVFEYDSQSGEITVLNRISHQSSPSKVGTE